jgi:hypothetical protein
MSKSDDLLNEIIARRRAKQLAPQQDILARVLDDLNAFDTLETLIERMKLCYGPKVISGEGRMGVVVWRRPPGYHGYKTLSLIGVWAVLREDQPQIMVGRKLLAFSAPFYDADAYHKLIRKNYDLYYNDDNQPPTAPSFSAPYESERRLELRETVKRAVAELL